MKVRANKVVDSNKPKVPLVDWPFVYWVIAFSTIGFGIASAVVYWKGW